MIDERELADMYRWHFTESGLDNRREAISRLIRSYSASLKVIQIAKAHCRFPTSRSRTQLQEALKPFLPRRVEKER